MIVGLMGYVDELLTHVGFHHDSLHPSRDPYTRTIKYLDIWDLYILLIWLNDKDGWPYFLL